MAKTFDSKIQELEQKKSELDLVFLENQKKGYEEKMYEILEESGEQEDAVEKLCQLRDYYTKIKDTNQRIQNNPEFLAKIEQKINFYKGKKEEVRNIPLQRDMAEAISETFKGDIVYQYAKEIGDEELIKNLESRGLSDKKYIDILEKDYRKYMESLYKNLFTNISTDQPSSESTSRKYVKLPKGMIEKIRKDLNDSKELKVNEVEKFLKNELKKNGGKIRISHIKNSFTKNYDFALKYISDLIINYSEFSLIDNNEMDKQTTNKRKSKHEKLKSSVSAEEIGNNRFDRLNRENLLTKIFSIKELDTLEARISKYVDLFEELGYRFSNRDIFEKELNESIIGHASHRIEKDIQKILVFTINGSDCFEKTGVYGYYTFKLNCGRRIIGYPNGEIFTICSHEEYDHIRDEIEPPKDKAI